MDKIECEIEILTPMFLGGAPQAIDSKPELELRLQSVKGVLRYWYRALIGPEYVSSKESDLFGSSDEKIGVSKIKIKTGKKKLTLYDKTQFPEIKDYMFNHPTQGFFINPLNYLAYGPVDNKRQIARKAFSPGSKFDLVFFLRGCTKEQRIEFIKTLFLWLNFGGLGSRSRKGYGAIKLLNDDTVFQGQDWFTKDNPINTLRQLMSNILSAEDSYKKTYSYIDKDTKLWISKKEGDSWDRCLSMLGRDYHKWKQTLSVANEREILGTPLLHGSLNYAHKRRASPYFLTVFKLADSYYKYGVLHIPSDYSKDTPIQADIQRNYHDKFQEAIEKEAKREV